MRILYITNSMGIGGIETNLVGLTARLRARGHEITVVSTGGPLVAHLERSGARHVRAEVDLRRPLGLAGAIVRFPSLLRRWRPDVVHAMSAAGNLVTVLASRRTPTLFVTSPMGLQMSEREPRVASTARNRLLAVRADRIFVISAEIRRAMEAAGVDGRRLIEQDVVGVELDRFASPDGQHVRRELGLVDGDVVVTTIGALHPRKSHELFVAAASRLLATLPRARFFIVGEGPQRGLLEQQIAHAGAQHAIRLLGARRDVPAILAATDIYVKPGVVEGFIGITVLEAMAVGRPVVAFDTIDVRAAIEPGRTGELARLADVDDLARAITRLVGEPAAAAALARAGRALVEERFSLDAVATRLDARYAELTRWKADRCAG